MNRTTLFCLTMLLAFTSCKKAPDTAPGIRIMPLGDSITQGSPTYPGYRPYLWQLLQEQGVQVNFVGSQNRHLGGHRSPIPHDPDHEGHWGWRTDQILERFPVWMDHAMPDVLLIHLGTNDLFQDKPIVVLTNQLHQIISIAKEVNPHVHILLGRIIPSKHAYDATVEYNCALDSFAHAHGVNLADHFTGFDYQTDTYDGIHPTNIGAKKMAKNWVEGLQPILHYIQRKNELKTTEKL